MLKLYLFVAMLLFGFALKAEEPALSLQGSGTESDPYLIGTGSDLLELASKCNPATVGTAPHYKGVHFRMTADIDMAGVTDFYGISTAPASAASNAGYNFGGIFDGNGHRIKNLTINGIKFDDTGKALVTFPANGSRKWVGLFGRIVEGAIIRNVIMDASCSITGATYVGGIVGEIAVGGIVENCINYASVTSYGINVGGIAGVMTSTKTKTTVIRTCGNAGEVRTNNSAVGGIVGQATYGTIENCANIGTVRAYNFNIVTKPGSQYRAGGIAGYGNGLVATDCVNFGTVYAERDNAGGFAGYLTLNSTVGSLSRFLNAGNVSGGNNFLSGSVIGNTGTTATARMTNFTSCLYDDQMLSTTQLAANGITAGMEGIVPATTAALTGSATLDLLNTWSFAEGRYPLPQALAANADLLAAAAAFIRLPEGQNANWVSAAATLNSASGLTMSLPEGTSLFSVSGRTLTPTPGSDMGTVAVELTNGSFRRQVLLTTFSIPFSGDGSDSSPFKLRNKADFQALHNIIAKTRFGFANRFFSLDQDVDFGNDTTFHGVAYMPGNVLGTGYMVPYTWHFDGVIYGNGHTIKNLKIDNVRRNADGNATNVAGGSSYTTGLFCALGAGAQIRDLVLDASCSVTGYNNTGSIAGQNIGYAVIYNCRSAATVTAYGRWAGGILGATPNASGTFDTPARIEGTIFSGALLTNYDYAGGIAGWMKHKDAMVQNCVNTGSVTSRHLDDADTDPVQIMRVAGLVAQNSGTIESSANYGPVFIDASAKVTTIDGVGGICAQSSNSGGYLSSIHHTFNAGQVYTRTANSAATVKDIGSILGWRYFGTGTNDLKNGVMAANYADTTLSAQPLVVGFQTNCKDESSWHGLPTSDLTSGNEIDSLRNYFVFRQNYYPMPAVLAEKPEVQAAACTFFRLPAGESIRLINQRESAPFNTVMPLTGSLADGSVFYLGDNRLRMHNDIGSDTLTLRNGTYFNVYPLYKTATSAVAAIDDATDPVVATRYYTTDGRAIAVPAPGTTVIAVSTTASGRTSAAKTIVR